METTKYRPSYLEFDVSNETSNVPENIGTFETADEAVIHMNQFFTTNTGLTVARFMDNFEKTELRKKYNDILENLLPKFEQEMRDAIDKFNHAKTEKENAIGMVDAYVNEAKQTAVEVKRGLVEIRLDELFTWKLPYKGRYYYFTYIDKDIRLVKVNDMTDSEKTELFSQGKINEDLFDNGTIKPQAGKKK